MVTQLPLDGVPLVKTGPSGVTIRLAREDEVETLRQIERSAAQALRLIEAFSWLSVGEVQAMLAAALDAAERFQPAFHFLILGDMTAEHASQAALFETCGEA